MDVVLGKMLVASKHLKCVMCEQRLESTGFYGPYLSSRSDFFVSLGKTLWGGGGYEQVLVL